MLGVMSGYLLQITHHALVLSEIWTGKGGMDPCSLGEPGAYALEVSRLAPALLVTTGVVLIALVAGRTRCNSVVTPRVRGRVRLTGVELLLEGGGHEQRLVASCLPAGVRQGDEDIAVTVRLLGIVSDVGTEGGVGLVVGECLRLNLGVVLRRRTGIGMMSALR